MGDFYQNGVVTTLHNLSHSSVEHLEEELLGFQQSRPMSLVLPSLYSELQTDALATIVDELTRVPYLNEIVVGLDRASQSEYEHALQYFSKLPQYHRVLWNEGPRLQAIDKLLEKHGLAPAELGVDLMRDGAFCKAHFLEVVLGDLAGLADALRHLVGLAETVADSPGSISHHEEGREAETTAPFHHLGAAVDENHLLDHRRTIARGIVAATMVATRTAAIVATLPGTITAGTTARCPGVPLSIGDAAAREVIR